MTTADTYWGSRGDLIPTAQAANILQLTPRSLSTALIENRIGGYRVAGKWLIAKRDLQGYLATDPRQRNNPARLLVDDEPIPTDEVALFLRDFATAIPLDVAAQLLDVGRSSLKGLRLLDGRPAFARTPAAGVDREELVEYLRSSANLGPRYV